MHPVVVVGLVCVVLQVAARGWASSRSFFYGDDYELISRLSGAPLTVPELLTPHDSQLMPGGIAHAWLLAQSGQHNWQVAAAIVVVWQAIASLACLLMLVTVFGRRWAILPLLVVYLASPLTLTSYMWWSSAINQVPLQAAFCLTIAAAVCYFRTGRRRWLVATLAAMALGLLFYVKAALLLPVVVGLGLLFYGPTTSRPSASNRLEALWQDVRARVTHRPLLLVSTLALVAAYTVYYLRNVNNPLESTDVDWLTTADNLFRLSYGPALIGGPWQWWNPIPPTGLVDPPGWATTATFVLFALVLYRLWQRGGARWSALILLGGYLAADYVLMATGRAAVIGSVAAREMRYIADAAPITVLCVGLLLLDSRRPHDSEPTPSVTTALADRRRAAVTVLVGALALSGAVASTVQYVRFWHADYASKVYINTVAAYAGQRDLRLIDGLVPPDVTPLSYPANVASFVFRPYPTVHFPSSGNDLQVLDAGGHPRDADIDAQYASAPGPREGCGYAVRNRPRTISLRQVGSQPVDHGWWVSIAYTAGKDATLMATLGDETETQQVLRGLHTLFVHVEGPLDEVTLQVDDPGVAMCVDEVLAGGAEVRTS